MTATLDTLIADVTARWPAVRVDPRELADALAARDLSPEAATAPDVALVQALSAGDRAALDVFERELLRDVRDAIAKLDPSGDLVDEVLQRVREKLLVGQPRIVEYRGRGSLVAWVQVIAIREALMIRRSARRERPLSDALVVAVESDPALALTKRANRDAFAASFRAALAKLAPRDRALLRLSFVDAVGTEQLARMYQVHRVTMFRWLCDARAHLLDGIRDDLAARTGVGADDIDSLIRAVASSLDLGW